MNAALPAALSASARDDAWGVRNQSNGSVAGLVDVPAFDRKTRNRGLLGRSSFPVGVAMVLAPCSAIHTWFMRSRSM